MLFVSKAGEYIFLFNSNQSRPPRQNEEIFEGEGGGRGKVYVSEARRVSLDNT